MAYSRNLAQQADFRLEIRPGNLMWRYKCRVCSKRPAGISGNKPMGRTSLNKEVQGGPMDWDLSILQKREHLDVPKKDGKLLREAIWEVTYRAGKSEMVC